MGDYADFHRHRRNLLIHLLAVPAFDLGVLNAAWQLLAGSGLAASASLAVAGVAMALQGWGHSLEPRSPRPFTSAWNGVARILTEQFLTFPAFLLSGGWWRAWRHGDSPLPD